MNGGTIKGEQLNAPRFHQIDGDSWSWLDRQALALCTQMLLLLKWAKQRLKNG